VPLRNLIGYLEDAYTLDEFLDESPSVSREQALEAADETLALGVPSSPLALPRHLARELIGHDVHTVRQQGWTGVNNGELLRRFRSH
jgi:hypothetical protein